MSAKKKERKGWDQVPESRKAAEGKMQGVGKSQTGERKQLKLKPKQMRSYRGRSALFVSEVTVEEGGLWPW